MLACPMSVWMRFGPKPWSIRHRRGAAHSARGFGKASRVSIGLPSRRRSPLYEVSSSKHGGVEGLPQVGEKGLATSRQRLTLISGDSWIDWLRTKPQRSEGGWWPFEKARSIVHKLRITSKEAWETYCRSGKKPADIPISVSMAYSRQWVSGSDWLRE